MVLIILSMCRGSLVLQGWFSVCQRIDIGSRIFTNSKTLLGHRPLIFQVYARVARTWGFGGRQRHSLVDTLPVYLEVVCSLLDQLAILFKDLVGKLGCMPVSRRLAK